MATQGFVHLLAIAANGSHEPQVFRMRWDQPLKRFARAYAVFRELRPEVEAELKMSTATHGKLDFTATAGAYGLSDGDEVHFTQGSSSKEPAALEPVGDKPVQDDATPSEASAPSASKEQEAPMQDQLDANSSRNLAASPELAACSANEEQEASVADNTVESPVQNLATSADVAASSPKEKQVENKGKPRGRPSAKSSGSRKNACDPKSSGAKVGNSGAGSGGASKSANEKTRSSTGGAGSNNTKNGRKSNGKAVKTEPKENQAIVAVETKTVKPKAKAKAKTKAKAKPKMLSRGKSVQFKGRQAAQSKLKAKGKAKAKTMVKSKVKVSPETQVSGGDAKKSAQGPWPRIGEPAVPRGNVRVQRVTMGPAKGWRVMAWLQDVTGTAPRTHDRTVRWRIQSPERTRNFTAFKAVQEEAGDGIYAQIYTAVRPLVLRRINDRRQELEEAPSKRRRSSVGALSNGEEAPIQTPARARQAAPKTTPVAQNALVFPTDGDAATQIFAPQRQVAPAGKVAWKNCACVSHLTRHPRCAFGGHMQPNVVHLRDYMLVGRGDTCDIVLNSRRTPQMISRCHAVIHKEETGFALVDQGSLNGVLVNGEAVQSHRPLVNGDVITFGVPSPQPEFDYIFEDRPIGLASCVAAKAANTAALETQLHEGFGQTDALVGM